MSRIYLDATPAFKVGDPAPDGYIARQEWANVQMKAGLKQSPCGWCFKYKFPFEMSEREEVTEAKTAKGRTVRQSFRICWVCATKDMTPIAPTPDSSLSHHE